MCWAEVTNGCAELLNRALGSDVPEVGNSLSLPPAGTHYKSFVTCSGVSLIPMTWASHGHTPEPTPDTKPRCPSWSGLAQTMGRADLHRNTGNTHNLLVCTHSIMLPASFLAFGSKCIAALTTSTFSTKDSVIKYSRLQHTINQSSLPVWVCNSAL